MGLQPSAVVNNANSKLLQIGLIWSNPDVPTPQRMAAIAALADDFRRAVAGSTTDPFRGAPMGAGICDREEGSR